MKVIAFDTETTGLTHDISNLLSDKNDYPLQLAAFLFDVDKIGEYFELSRVEPDGALVGYLKYGKEPHPGAYNVHHIDKAKTEYLGVSPLEMLPLLAEFLDAADCLVGHNLEYDMDILRIAYARAGYSGDPFQGRQVFDTMIQSAPLCKLPAKRMKHPEDWKFPKLIEAYNFFFGRDFPGAHGAIADTLAAFDIYLALQGKSAILEKSNGNASA